MKILKIRLKNFGIFKDKIINISEDTKVFAVVGNNGLGKTTILRAIELVFGSKDRTYEDFLPFDGSSTSYEIYVTGIYRNETIEIGLFYDGSSKRTLTYRGEKLNGQDVQKFLNEHFDSDILSKTNFGTSSFSITERTPTEIRSYLEKLLNVDFKDKVAEIKLAKQLEEKKVVQFETEISLLTSKLYPKIDTTKPAFTEDYLEEKERRLSECVSSLSNMDRYDSLVKDNRTLNHLIEQLELELKKLDQSELTTEALEPLEIEALAAVAKLHVLSNEKDELIKDKGSIIFSKGTYEKELMDLKTQRDNIQHLVECPTCFQGVDINHREFLKTFLEREISSRVELIARSSKDVRNIELSIVELKKKQDNYQRVVDSFETIKAQNNIISREREGKKALLRSKVEQLIRVEEDLSKFGDMSLSRDSLEFHKSSLINDIKSMKGLWEDYRVNLALQADQDTMKSNDAKRITTLKNELITSNLEIEVLSALSNLLSKTLPIKIMNEVLKKISKRMNRFIFGVYERGLETKFEEKNGGINLLYSRDGIFTNASNASGFEKQLINLVFRVVTGMLAHLGILFLDEPDSNASEENSENLFDGLMDYLLKENKVEQLFYISHRSSVLERLEHREGSETLHLG